MCELLSPLKHQTENKNRFRSGKGLEKKIIKGGGLLQTTRVTDVTSFRAGGRERRQATADRSLPLLPAPSWSSHGPRPDAHGAPGPPAQRGRDQALLCRIALGVILTEEYKSRCLGALFNQDLKVHVLGDAEQTS